MENLKFHKSLSTEVLWRPMIILLCITLMSFNGTAGGSKDGKGGGDKDGDKKKDDIGVGFHSVRTYKRTNVDLGIDNTHSVINVYADRNNTFGSHTINLGWGANVGNSQNAKNMLTISQFSASPTKYMFVNTDIVAFQKSNVKVGIGLQGPQTLLHLDASGVQDVGQKFIKMTGSFKGIRSIDQLILASDDNGTHSGGIMFNVGGYDLASERMRIQTDGDVGIGFTNPQERLAVNGGVQIGNTSNTNAGTLRFTGSQFQGYDGSNWIALAADGSPVWTEHSSGHFTTYDGAVGIGTDNPSATLHVKGAHPMIIEDNGHQLHIAENLDHMCFIANQNTGMHFSVNNTITALTIPQSGKVGIGTNTPSEQLEVNGGIKVGNSTGTNPGTIRYENGSFSAYTGSDWEIFAGAGREPRSPSPWVEHGNNISFGGRVGIGTDSPVRGLHLKDKDGILVEQGEIKILIDEDQGHHGWIGTQSNHSLLFGAGFDSKMIITPDGNVGINDFNPTHRLSVNGGIKVDGFAGVQMSANNNTGIINAQFNIEVTTEQNDDRETAWIGTTTDHDFGLYTNDHGRFFLKNDGKIGIGTNTPATDFQVNGNVLISNNTPPTISATSWDRYQLVVTKGILTENYGIAPKAQWADHVFESDYELLDLEEVEAFIKANKHLPAVPSAQEVAEEGYSLHEMNMRFMEKIEELTLYTIEQQKEIKALKAEMADMKKAMEQN